MDNLSKYKLIKKYLIDNGFINNKNGMVVRDKFLKYYNTYNEEYNESAKLRMNEEYSTKIITDNFYVKKEYSKYRLYFDNRKISFNDFLFYLDENHKGDLGVLIKNLIFKLSLEKELKENNKIIKRNKI